MVSAGVRQGLILSPLVLLIYISDVKYNSLSSFRLFHGDESLIKETYYNVNVLTNIILN